MPVPGLPNILQLGANGGNMGLFDFIGDVVDFFGDEDAQDQNRGIAYANMEAQAAANAQNLALARERNSMELDMFNRGLAAQGSAIQTRVADAAAAGVHPLAALGSNFSISPGQANFVTPQVNPVLNEHVVSANHMGQNLARSVGSMMTKQERSENKMLQTFNRERAILEGTLDLDRREKENNLLDMQLKLAQNELAQRQAGPPAPAVKPYPKPREDPGVSDYQYSHNADGGLSVIPTPGVKNAIEDSPMEWLWFWRNNVIPNRTPGPHSPDVRKYPPPAGYNSWRWDTRTQSYKPANLGPGKLDPRRIFKGPPAGRYK